MRNRAHGIVYRAGNGDDFVVASDFDDVLYGDGGNDLLNGEDGSDVLIGGVGADQMLGGGADNFILYNLDAHGPRILWGGAGADVFKFQNGGRVSLAVVNIDGLTKEAFSRLTLADLGLGNIDLSLLCAIIINPDATDRFKMDDTLLGTSAVKLGDWSGLGDAPDLVAHLVPGYSSPVAFGVRTSDYLGDSYAIQAVYDNEVRAHHQTTFSYNFFDITVWSEGEYRVVETDNHVAHWINDVDEAIDDALMSAELDLAQFDVYGYDWATSDYWRLQEPSNLPTGPFLVVGGQFDGNSLAANGDLSGSLPDARGPSPFDWRLAA